MALSPVKPEKNSFNFYVFSDTHRLNSLNRKQVLNSMISNVNQVHTIHLPTRFSYLKPVKAKLALICGDFTDNGQTDQWKQIVNLFGLNGEM